ncbi:hypothetical protein ACOME3_001633 [Neoechinorhynchus agilis]
MILERQLQNGGKEIRLSDGSRTVIDTSGIVITETSEGDRLINYPDGRKEYHTENYRKKIYPNQRTVIEYKDGRIEVQYDEKNTYERWGARLNQENSEISELALDRTLYAFEHVPVKSRTFLIDIFYVSCKFKLPPKYASSLTSTVCVWLNSI